MLIQIIKRQVSTLQVERQVSLQMVPRIKMDLIDPVLGETCQLNKRILQTVQKKLTIKKQDIGKNCCVKKLGFKRRKSNLSSKYCSSYKIFPI